jgi:hypothetical protein
MGDHYQRVIPRDLFNEASLLKCLGQLVLLQEQGWQLHMSIVHSGEAFNIVQNDEDGSICCTNVSIFINNVLHGHFRPLNSRDPWPLYVHKRNACEAEEILVFTDEGNFTEEFTTYMRQRR